MTKTGKINVLACLIFFFLVGIAFPFVALAQEQPQPAQPVDASKADPFANNETDKHQALNNETDKPQAPNNETSESSNWTEEASEICEQRSCENAGKSLIYSFIAIDAVGIFFALLLLFFFTKKVWFTSNFKRFLVAGILVSAVVGVVIAFNPFEDKVLKCCLASPDMIRFLMFSAIVTKPWFAGLVLGAIPVFGGFFIVKLIHAIFVSIWRK